MKKKPGQLVQLARNALEMAGAGPVMAAAAAQHLVCAALTGSAIGPEADSFFVEKGNKPRIGHAFLAIDPDALTGHGRYFERVEAVITAMLADDLLAKIEKLAA